MQYIDKLKYAKAGTRIADELLEESWNESDGCYYGADYDGLSKPRYKKELIRLLLAEQHDVCCYCMKNIDATDVCVEHIISQAACSDEVEPYFSAPELIQNVVHRSVFDFTTHRIPPEKYPHDIAYHNLIASCKSLAHCNNYRGKRPIKPLVYDPQIHNAILYDKQGNLFSENYSSDCDSLGLFTRLLRSYRRIWYHLSHLGDAESITENDIERTLIEWAGEPDFVNIIEDFYGEPSKRNDLLKYKWFYFYYKNTDSGEVNDNSC